MRPFRGARPKRLRWWIPEPIQAWFRGERSKPITAMSVPFRGMLVDLWEAWIEVHPDAVRPADWPAVSDRERKEGQKYLTRSQPRWYGPDGGPRDVGRT